MRKKNHRYYYIIASNKKPRPVWHQRHAIHGSDDFQPQDCKNSLGYKNDS